MRVCAAELITTQAGLEALAPEWAVLWRRAGEATTPFQSPWWLLAWWRQFGTDHLVIAIERGADGELIGVFPTYVLEQAGRRTLLPVGAGSSDYLDALIDPAAPPQTVERLLDAVLGGAVFAQCDLIDLPPGAALRDAATPWGWRSSLHGTAVCPVLVLPDTLAGLAEVVPAGARRKLRMNRHRADRAGGWTISFSDAGDAVGRLARLEALHRSRWDARGAPGGVLADARMGAMLAEAVPALLGAQAAWLIGLTIGSDSEPTAACLAFVGLDRLFLYLSGFDTARAFESPGTLLMGALLETAIQRGFREVHFLRGGEAYKYGWGACDRLNATRTLRRA